MSIRLLVQPKRSALWYRRTTCAARTRQFVWRNEWERGQCDVRVPDRGDGARDDRVVGEFDRSPSISGGVRGGLMVMSITRVLPLVGRGRSRKYMENATTTATSRQTIHSRGSLGSGRTTAGMLRSSKKHTRNTRATCCPPNLSALTAYPHYHAKCLTAVPRRAGHTSRAQLAPRSICDIGSFLVTRGETLSRPHTDGAMLSAPLRSRPLPVSLAHIGPTIDTSAHAPAGTGQTNSVSGNRPNRIVTSDP